jgi:hypothetical protein
MTNSEILETMPMSWVIYFSQPSAFGVIFFDEINLAAPVVAGAAYQIINDRVCADRKLSDHVWLMAAGNRHGKDKAFTFSMPAPLRDRFAEIEITHDVQAWTEWAAGVVNPNLISLCNWKESLLYNMDKADCDKGSTPRGVVRASKLIEGLDLSDKAQANKANMYVSIAVGEAFAAQFLAYCKHFQSLKWENIYNNPASVESFESDKLYAVGGGMAEQFDKEVKNNSKPKALLDKLDNILNVVQHMPEDFAVVTLRMIRDTNDKSFRQTIKKSDHFDDVVDRYGKFIISE